MNARIVAPSPLLVAVLLLAVAACTSAGPSPSGAGPSGPPASGSPLPTAPGNQAPDGAFANLAGTGWRVIRVGDLAPVAGSEPTIAFLDGRIEGTTGCNSYGGSVTIEGASIEAGEMMMTLIGCMDDVAAMETAFLAALDGAEELSSQGANLVIGGPGGDILLRPDATVN